MPPKSNKPITSTQAKILILELLKNQDREIADLLYEFLSSQKDKNQISKHAAFTKAYSKPQIFIDDLPKFSTKKDRNEWPAWQKIFHDLKPDTFKFVERKPPNEIRKKIKQYLINQQTINIADTDFWSPSLSPELNVLTPREEEVDKLCSFLFKKNKITIYYGNPRIGKSEIINQLIRKLKKTENNFRYRILDCKTIDISEEKPFSKTDDFFMRLIDNTRYLLILENAEVLNFNNSKIGSFLSRLADQSNNKQLNLLIISRIRNDILSVDNEHLNIIESEQFINPEILNNIKQIINNDGIFITLIELYDHHRLHVGLLQKIKQSENEVGQLLEMAENKDVLNLLKDDYAEQFNTLNDPEKKFFITSIITGKVVLKTNNDKVIANSICSKGLFDRTYNNGYIIHPYIAEIAFEFYKEKKELHKIAELIVTELNFNGSYFESFIICAKCDLTSIDNEVKDYITHCTLKEIKHLSSDPNYNVVILKAIIKYNTDKALLLLLAENYRLAGKLSEATTYLDKVKDDKTMAFGYNTELGFYFNAKANESRSNNDKEKYITFAKGAFEKAISLPLTEKLAGENAINRYLQPVIGLYNLNPAPEKQFEILFNAFCDLHAYDQNLPLYYFEKLTAFLNTQHTLNQNFTKFTECIIFYKNRKFKKAYAIIQELDKISLFSQQLIFINIKAAGLRTSNPEESEKLLKSSIEKENNAEYNRMAYRELLLTYFVNGMLNKIESDSALKSNQDIIVEVALEAPIWWFAKITDNNKKIKVLTFFNNNYKEEFKNNGLSDWLYAQIIKSFLDAGINEIDKYLHEPCIPDPKSFSDQEVKKIIPILQSKIIDNPDLIYPLALFSSTNQHYEQLLSYCNEISTFNAENYHFLKLLCKLAVDLKDEKYIPQLSKIDSSIAKNFSYEFYHAALILEKTGKYSLADDFFNKAILHASEPDFNMFFHYAFYLLRNSDVSNFKVQISEAKKSWMSSRLPTDRQSKHHEKWFNLLIKSYFINYGFFIHRPDRNLLTKYKSEIDNIKNEYDIDVNVLYYRWFADNGSEKEKKANIIKLNNWCKDNKQYWPTQGLTVQNSTEIINSESEKEKSTHENTYNQANKHFNDGSYSNAFDLYLKLAFEGYSPDNNRKQVFFNNLIFSSIRSGKEINIADIHEELLLDVGKTYKSLKIMDKNIECLEKIPSNHKDYYSSSVILARIYLEENNLIEAGKYLKINKLNKKDPESLITYAALLDAKNNFKEALTCIDMAFNSTHDYGTLKYRRNLIKRHPDAFQSDEKKITELLYKIVPFIKNKNYNLSDTQIIDLISLTKKHPDHFVLARKALHIINHTSNGSGLKNYDEEFAEILVNHYFFGISEFYKFSVYMNAPDDEYFHFYRMLGNFCKGCKYYHIAEYFYQHALSVIKNDKNKKGVINLNLALLYYEKIKNHQSEDELRKLNLFKSEAEKYFTETRNNEKLVHCNNLTLDLNKLNHVNDN